ncbi:MAG: hypothetical protein HZC37_29810 [Burkholderiales bacterium]|nr:hypothetical protein [Burkholderiales bacterium]
MRPAPSLALQCASSRAWRLACAVVGAAAGASVAAWAGEHLEWAPPALASIVGCGTLAGAVLGLRIAGSARSFDIRWDGQGWQVDGVRGRLQVMLDFDRRLLLLRHRPDGPARARWIAVSFARGGLQGLHGLRVLRTALYSRPPEATPEQPHVRAPDRATD